MLEPTDAEIIANAIDARLLDVHTSAVGRVRSYDAEKQVADIELMMSRPLPVADGSVVEETLPVLPNVPVRWMRAGGFVVHMPLKKGDYVSVEFTECSIAQWRETGEPGPVGDRRRFSLDGAFAVPGVAPVGDEITDVPDGVLVIGKDGAQQQIRITGDEVGGVIQLGAEATEHVMTAEATALLIYNVLVALMTAAGGGPLLAATLQPLLGAAITTALTAQTAPAPPTNPAQQTAAAALQAGFAAGTTPSPALFAAWVPLLAALATKTPNASGLFPSVGAATAKTE